MDDHHIGARAGPARASLAGLLLLVLVAWPATSSSFDLLGEIKKAVPRQLDPLLGKQPANPAAAQDQTPAGVNTAAGVVGLIGIGACARGNKANDKRALCLVGAALAAEMTRQLGTRIADGLREHEQRKVLAAAADSLKTGEPSVVDLPDSGTTVTVGPVGTESLREVRVELLIDPSAVQDVPLMRVLGETQEIRAAHKLRSAAAANASTVGTLRAGETVHVIGRVDGGDAVLVSRWVTADGMAKPVGTGFVNASALQASARKDFPSDADVLKTAPTMKTITVNAILKCQSLDFKKKDSKGNRVEDTSYLCVGPDGSTRSA